MTTLSRYKRKRGRGIVIPGLLVASQPRYPERTDCLKASALTPSLFVHVVYETGITRRMPSPHGRLPPRLVGQQARHARVAGADILRVPAVAEPGCQQLAAPQTPRMVSAMCAASGGRICWSPPDGVSCGGWPG